MNASINQSIKRNIAFSTLFFTVDREYSKPVVMLIIDAVCIKVQNTVLQATVSPCSTLSNSVQRRDKQQLLHSTSNHNS